MTVYTTTSNLLFFLFLNLSVLVHRQPYMIYYNYIQGLTSWRPWACKLAQGLLRCTDEMPQQRLKIHPQVVQELQTKLYKIQ